MTLLNPINLKVKTSNWKLSGKDFWIHKKRRYYEIEVYKEDGKWLFQVIKQSGKDNVESIDKKFNTRPEALKFARAYMAKH